MVIHIIASEVEKWLLKLDRNIEVEKLLWKFHRSIEVGMVRVDIQKPAWARAKRQGRPIRKNFDTRQTWEIKIVTLCDSADSFELACYV